MSSVHYQMTFNFYCCFNFFIALRCSYYLVLGFLCYCEGSSYKSFHKCQLIQFIRRRELVLKGKNCSFTKDRFSDVLTSPNIVNLKFRVFPQVSLKYIVIFSHDCKLYVMAILMNYQSSVVIQNLIKDLNLTPIKAFQFLNETLIANQLMTTQKYPYYLNVYLNKIQI